MPWRHGQLPRDQQVFLDHVGFFVPDIEAVGRRLERIGFNPQPVSVHYDGGAGGSRVRSGTANRLVTFETGYIEVLGKVSDTALGRELEAALSRYEGVHLIALTHPDVTGRAAVFEASRIPMRPTVALRRPVPLPEGEAEVRATVARCVPGVMPEGRVQMLTHHTPELIWRAGFTAHPNRVNALHELLVVSATPDEAARRHQTFSGCTVSAAGGISHVDFDRGRLSFVAPDQAARVLPGLDVPDLPFCAAVVLGCADLDAARSVLAGNGVLPLADRPDRLVIGPGEGLGAYLVLLPERDLAPDEARNKDIWPRMAEARGL